MDHGSFADSGMVINSGIKGYEEIIRIMLDKTSDNPGMAVDIKLKEFLNE